MIHKLIMLIMLLLMGEAAFAQVTLTVDGKPIPKADIVITTGGVVPPPVCTGGQVWNGSACVCPGGTVWNGSQCVQPTPPPTNCVVANAPTQLGGNPPIPPSSMGVDQPSAFRIAASLLDDRSVGAFQPTVGLSVSVSNQACDFGTAPTNAGCYLNVSSISLNQRFIRVTATGGGGNCKKPQPTPDGYLYVNFRWAVYPSSNLPIGNYCEDLGFTSCTFQFRRDP